MKIGMSPKSLFQIVSIVSSVAMQYQNAYKSDIFFSDWWCKMMGRTHAVFGFLIGLFALPYLNVLNPILYVAAVLVGAHLPDVDHPDSTLGKYVKPIGLLFSHRGFFHSVFAAALVYAVPFYLFGNATVAFGLLIGYVSHIIGDIVTVQGVRIFAPLSSFTLRGFMYTDSITEHILCVLFVVAAVWKLFQM